MQEFPFPLPKSLQSYIELFPENKERTIEKLDAHLKKRGYDAVGHFLMSWFYLQLENKTKALEYALAAKAYAPGSPFLEYAHYFMAHPNALDAVIPQTIFRDGKKIKKTVSSTSFLIDLEDLISKLSHIEGQKIVLKPSSEQEDDIDLSVASINIDDLATETLAQIHIKQGNKENAVAIYKRLMEKEPNKKTYFEEKIAALSN
ncbi:hypothetical protein EP331_09290 [bacterium]|nr:MAG: hypothetical protein EP331_09290 [bacterium]